MRERPDEDRCGWGKCRQQADCYLARVPFCRHHSRIILNDDDTDFATLIRKNARSEWKQHVDTRKPE